MQRSPSPQEAEGFFRLLNAFFDKIYVLTVPSSGERQQAFAQSMAGLDFHFFYGLDRSTLSMDELKSQGIYDEAIAQRTQRHSKKLSVSEIACSLGHCNIYRDIIANNIQRALIFEDDVFPLPENMGLLDEMLRSLPADWQIFYFDYNKNEKVIPLKRSLYYVQKSLGFLNMEYAVINNLFPRKVNKDWRFAGFHDYTDSYAVTIEAAKKLLELQTPVSMTSDNLLANAITKEHLVGYVPVTKMFAQKSVGSSASIESLVERFVDGDKLKP